jgi:hypothetical protein
MVTVLARTVIGNCRSAVPSRYDAEAGTTAWRMHVPTARKLTRCCASIEQIVDAALSRVKLTGSEDSEVAVTV